MLQTFLLLLLLIQKRIFPSFFSLIWSTEMKRKKNEEPNEQKKATTLSYQSVVIETQILLDKLDLF